IRLPGSLGKAYYERKKAEGMSASEALRCLKRRLARIVYNTLKNRPRSDPRDLHLGGRLT
ncbi:MAG: hypothetical protein WBL05_08755, partial [Brooklawnia sp.]